MNDRPIRILVVDDSALYRQSIRNVLRDIEGVDVIGSAANGLDALEKIGDLKPDLLTLDVEMPGMNGIELLRELKVRKVRPKAIMVSSFTSVGAQVTTEALMEGAFDFILKPIGDQASANRETLYNTLHEKIVAFRSSLTSKVSVSCRSTASTSETTETPSTVIASPRGACRLVILGTSTGGPAALKHVLPKLPSSLPVPVIVVQHMPAKYTLSLATRLDATSELNVIEGYDGLAASPGQIILASGGRQTKVIADGKNLRIAVTDDPPENGIRPSVDYTIRSAIAAVDGNALAVILTGMGRDGLEGCRVLKAAGGSVFAQSQIDSVVYGMPKAVIDAGLADRTLTLGKVAPAIVRHVKRSRGV
ncbi:MAG: chemotaxis-specific protein-glutamate methyltransferase CheB [Planctomycetota bacterium]